MKKVFLILFFFVVAVIPFNILFASNAATIVSTGGTSNSGIYYTDSSGNKVNVYLSNYTVGESDAYCLHPGRKGPSNGGLTYYEDETYDVSNCSSNFSYECGLAFILSESLSGDYTYRATETALRLFAAYSVDASSEMSGSDGWYDAETGVSVRASIYQNTARAAMSWGYNVDNYHNCTNMMTGEITECVDVLYGEGQQGEDLKAGIELFKKIMQGGVENNWTPQIELTNTVRDENGLVTFTLSTNFNSNTVITVPSTISGYDVTSTITNCDSGCQINITVNVPSPDECVTFDFDILFKDPRYSLSTIKRYKPAGGQAQYFLSYDTELTYDKEPIENKYPIQYEWCEETDDECCPDMRIQEDIPLTCDESNEGSVEDPEMCTIINACDKNKQKSYDYTEKFGLNEEYCTLFCREEIEFTFMDRTEVIAGRQFKYDVNSRITTTQMLSTVIYGTRQCTSPDIDYEKWEEDYLAADEAVISAWETLKFWETIYNNTGGGIPTDVIEMPDSSTNCCGQYGKGIENWQYVWEGPWPYNSCSLVGENSINCAGSSAATTDEGLEALSWDTTCCGYDDDGCISCCTGCGKQDATEGDYYKVINTYNAAVRSYKAALEKREKLLMDIQNCNLLKYSDFTYLPEEYYVAASAGTYKYSFSEQDTAYYKIVDDYDFNSTIEIEYEDDYSPMIYIDKDEPIQHITTQGWCKDCEYETYCPSCSSEPAINSSMSVKPDLRRIVCEGSETSAKCEIEPTPIPNNHAANLTTSKEQHFWQSATFYTQLYTGTVSTAPNGQGYWIGLDEYIYPITLNKRDGSYGVHVDISNIGAATRPENIKIDDQEFDCAFEVINETTMYECDPRIEVCYQCDPIVEVCDEIDDPKVSLGMVVRSVDLTNLFPTSRAIGMNWKNATNVINAIQSLGDEIWIDKQPQYVIDLSPSNIRNIKNYNNYTDYMDYSISCDSTLNCISNFLTSISTNTDYAYNVDISLGRNKTVDDFNNHYKYGG